uniref:Orphan G-protein coupled receptor 9 n=1 Tax=Platynereis dumerilii TaxID=6359 RepID=A0A0K0PVM6_PLADU|nr:orphan G-protein coupled receptor 9 [Platynereis dumerilii]
MASPAQQSICCLFHNSSVYNGSHFSEVNWSEIKEAYNWICLVSASLSACGAIYQILPRAPRYFPKTQRELDAFVRQRSLIRWLAVADLMAVAGILTRSIVWQAHRIPWRPQQGEANIDFAHLFCAVISGWVMFFYLSTYAWTVCYSFDIMRLVSDKGSKMVLYHICGWVVPMVLTVGGLLPFYLPSLTSCRDGKEHWLPHYLVTYCSILLVIIITPVLYYISSKKVRTSMRRRGLYTNHERRVIQTISSKYFAVTLVFFVCWSPNLVNGILLLFEDKVPSGYFISLWNYMAVVNPMQALLNSLVYRGFGSCTFGGQEAFETENARKRVRKNPREGVQYQSATDFEDSENAPLLSFRAVSI